MIHKLLSPTNGSLGQCFTFCACFSLSPFAILLHRRFNFGNSPLIRSFAYIIISQASAISAFFAFHFCANTNILRWFIHDFLSIGIFSFCFSRVFITLCERRSCWIRRWMLMRYRSQNSDGEREGAESKIAIKRVQRWIILGQSLFHPVSFARWRLSLSRLCLLNGRWWELMSDGQHPKQTNQNELRIFLFCFFFLTIFTPTLSIYLSPSLYLRASFHRRSGIVQSFGAAKI